MATMIMSLAANAFGLNNAATPLGIKAMEELQELNPEKDTATNAMVTFLAIITSGVQLIPATAIAVLAAAGSTAPTSIISTTFVATLAATIAGLIAAKVLQRFFPAGGSAVERDTP
jgi:spore maturation protein A